MSGTARMNRPYSGFLPTMDGRTDGECEGHWVGLGWNVPPLVGIGIGRAVAAVVEVLLTS